MDLIIRVLNGFTYFSWFLLVSCVAKFLLIHERKLSIFFYRKCEWINFILKYTIFVIHWYILKKIGQLLWEQCQINIFLKTIE